MDRRRVRAGIVIAIFEGGTGAEPTPQGTTRYGIERGRGGLAALHHVCVYVCAYVYICVYMCIHEIYAYHMDVDFYIFISAYLSRSNCMPSCPRSHLFVRMPAGLPARYSAVVPFVCAVFDRRVLRDSSWAPCLCLCPSACLSLRLSMCLSKP